MHGDAAPSEPLSRTDVERWLHAHDGWQREGNAINKRFRLPSFRAAIEFVGHVADLAEERQHHPNIDIRYRNVIIGLTTHDVGGISPLDLELAQALDELAG